MFHYTFRFCIVKYFIIIKITNNLFFERFYPLGLLLSADFRKPCHPILKKLTKFFGNQFIHREIVSEFFYLSNALAVVSFAEYHVLVSKDGIKEYKSPFHIILIANEYACLKI